MCLKERSRQQGAYPGDHSEMRRAEAEAWVRGRESGTRRPMGAGDSGTGEVGKGESEEAEEHH